MPLLEVKGVSKRFGGVHAVNDVSFQVEKGMIKAVIGPVARIQYPCPGVSSVRSLTSGAQSPGTSTS